MLTIRQRIWVQALGLVAAFALGMMIWIGVLSAYEQATDEYWTAYGHPPPLAAGFGAPGRLMPFILIGPYIVLLTGRAITWQVRHRAKV